MRAYPIGRKKNARLLRTRSLWLCLFASLLAIAIMARPALREVLAQTSSPPAASSQQVTSAAQDSSAQSHAVNPAAKQDTRAPALTDLRQRQIANDSANLLKLANNLKAEVDKTTADTLSISVVRHAEEIEKLAHKLRTR
jgi:hypothetical protein